MGTLATNERTAHPLNQETTPAAMPKQTKKTSVMINAVRPALPA